MRRAAGSLLAALAVLLGAADARADTVSTTFTTSDGVMLRGTLTGEAPLTARPTVVEFSPYGVASGTFDPGPGFNSLVVEDRGTGRSGGGFDALGPLAQRDVAETLAWACKQPWSNGSLGLSGFSASAITVYNSLHLPLPCVKAAVLRSGTFELYRDLLSPGGVSNILPGAAVLLGIGGGALAAGAERDLLDTPGAIFADVLAGLGVVSHPDLDGFWVERGWRGNANHIPVLAVGGFYDVESRGAFQGYQALKADGAHLLVASGHDQKPAGTDGGQAESVLWFAHYLAGADNGVERHPRVQLLMSRGSRQSFAAGDVERYGASDWPVPGTRWTALELDAARSGTSGSPNDGTLSAPASSPRPVSQDSYAAAVSIPTMTDVPNAGVVDSSGASAITAGFPLLTDIRLAEPLGLSWTTPPLQQDLLAAGPAALEVSLATTAPSSAIWAVVSDVGPDGIAHPLGVGRLSTDHPGVDAARSLVVDGETVQPYGEYDMLSAATPGQARRYQVELWPLGNRFVAGHRIRLSLVGQSLASAPRLPGVNTVTLGGERPSRLLLPVTPAQAAPSVAAASGADAARCTSKRVFSVHVRRRFRGALRAAEVRVDGRRVARLRHGRTAARVDLRRATRRTVRVAIVMRLRDGRRVVDRRTYRPCRGGAGAVSP